MSKFVPFKIAKKLKENGFKEECVAHYYSNDPTCRIKNTALADYVQQPFCIESIKRSWNRCELNPCSSGCYYDAPTISQVLKWLREEKNIHLIVEIADSGWYYTLYPNVRWENDKLKSDTYIMSFKHKTSYEEAVLAGIEYCLDNLI